MQRKLLEAWLGYQRQAAAARLLERFFGILKDWKFPTPIALTPTHDAGLGLEVWDPQVGRLQPGLQPVACNPSCNPWL